MEKARFFQKTFLIADTRIDIVLEISFLTLNNANIQFIERDFIWKIYIVANILPTIKKIQIIDRKKFAKTVLDPNKKVFVVNVTTITSEKAIYLVCQAQIALLKAEKVSVTVPKKYLDYTDIFSKKFPAMLSEHIEINTHTID